MSRVVYGIHAVTELLLRGRSEVRALFIQSGQSGEGRATRPILAEARRLGITPIEQPRKEIDRLTQGGVHQGVVALCGPYEYKAIPELLAGAVSQPPLILILDGVQDPQNLGALLRSASVLSAHGVVLPADRAAQVTAAVVKASAGAAEHVPVARVTNLSRAMEELKEAGLWLYGAVAESEDEQAQLPWQLDLEGPVGLVLGSEGRGLRPLTRKICDGTVRVPVVGEVHGASLNVAAAGAVLLYEALRQRTLKTSDGT